MAAENEILAAILTIRGPVASVVEAACAQAGVRAVVFDGVTPPASPASLVIAELRAGDRRVPQRVLDAVALAGGKARLLLLCAEPLVRPHVSTQGGKVMMVSPPHSASRVSNRIRVLLAGANQAPGGGWLARHDSFTERWWLCAFESGAPQGVLVQPGDAVGMTAVLPPPGGSAGPEILQRAVELLARERSDEARWNWLAQLAGPCAVVHLSAAGDRWLFHWPSLGWPLRIHSPQRLPPHADVAARASRRRAWSMVAAPGDLLLAYTAPLAEADATPGDLRRAASEGVPGAVDLLDAAAERTKTPLSGLAVEVH